MKETIDVTVLQEIVDAAITGRESHFVCPMCGADSLETADLDEFELRLECRKCNKFIEVPLTP